MADFELLAPGGHQKLVDEVLDRLDLKADIDGYYAQLTAGAADNLTGRGDATTAEFLYRTSGGTADIETGQAVAKSIKGNTLRWNQLAQYGHMASNGSTVTTSGNTATVTSTITSGTYFGVAIVPSTRHAAANGHKYYVVADVDMTGITDQTLSKVTVSFGSLTATSVGTDSITASGRIACIATTNATGTGGSTYINALFSSAHDTSGQSFTVTNAMVMDLTAMFGAGSEPTTIEEFEALFPQPYYEYDAGSLLPVNMTGIETTGFNQWDGTYSITGSYLNYNGVTSTDTEYDISDYIPVIGGQTYYVKGLNGSSIALCWYDAEKQYIGGLRNYDLTRVNPANTFTVPSNAAYVRSSVPKVNASTFCINLSWSGRRNGEYEPYWSAQREIAASTYFPDGMRSAGSVYDELTSTEAITRVGEITLDGSSDESYSDVYSIYGGARIALQNAGLNASDPSTQVVCDLIAVNTHRGATSYVGDDCLKTYSSASDSGFIVICKSGVTSVAELRAWLASNPITIHYALATPTVTPIDPALNLSYRVDDFGTERIMVPEDERSAPPVLDIAYGLNVVDFVRRAPTEYISAASFAQYLLARDAHDGTTTTMTWDDTDNRYEFTITDTVTEG